MTFPIYHYDHLSDWMLEIWFKQLYSKRILFVESIIFEDMVSAYILPQAETNFVNRTEILSQGMRIGSYNSNSKSSARSAYGDLNPGQGWVSNIVVRQIN